MQADLFQQPGATCLHSLVHCIWRQIKAPRPSDRAIPETCSRKEILILQNLEYTGQV